MTRYVALGLGAILLVLASLAGVDSCRKNQGSQAEIQSAIHQGEANSHAVQAQAIPDHKAELQTAQAGVDRAQREVARLRRLLAAAARPGVPGDASPDPAAVEPVAPDHRDELLAAQDELIAKQAGQISTLKVALTDEQARSEQFRLAFESERKATAAQQAATEAWKKAVTTSKWRGRIEGFAAGVALGYVARGQR